MNTNIDNILLEHNITVEKGVTHTKIIDVLNKINKKHKKEITSERFELPLKDALRKRQKINKVCIDCGKKFQVWYGYKRTLAKRCIWCSQNHKNARGYKRKSKKIKHK